MLGYMLKRFAKVCDMCDASRGSLSSYAYIIMVIYFLQQCSPPVLPVLQEVRRFCMTKCKPNLLRATSYVIMSSDLCPKVTMKC
jgi:DNA polymerase sigma